MTGLFYLEGQMGLGHLRRPRKFTIANTVCVGMFPCRLPLAIFTHDIYECHGVKAYLAPTIKNNRPKGRAFFMEGQMGLEPMTFCLRGRRSNQLSYWPIYNYCKVLWAQIIGLGHVPRPRNFTTGKTSCHRKVSLRTATGSSHP